MIIFENLAEAKNVMKVIRGIYIEFNEVDISKIQLGDYLPHYIPSNNLFEQSIRFGKTSYYIQKYMLVIRLNIAFLDKNKNEIV